MLRPAAELAPAVADADQPLERRRPQPIDQGRAEADEPTNPRQRTQIIKRGYAEAETQPIPSQRRPQRVTRPGEVA